MERRFWMGVVLTIPILAGAMIEMIVAVRSRIFFSQDIWCGFNSFWPRP